MSVLFVQHTPGSELAKRIREKLESLEKVGTLKFKVLEKTGSKLEEILHKSDAWNDRDCGREDCLLCSSASEDDKKGVCKRRYVVYETYCITCYEREKGKKDERELYNQISHNKDEKVTSAEIIEGKRKREGNNKKEKKVEKRRKEYKVKYVGETGRSAYERGAEHISDFHNFDEGSHLLKHYLACHRDIKMSDMKIGMRVRNVFRTALERQIGEAVAIDMEQRKRMELLNSKSEYNRCQIPGITTVSYTHLTLPTNREV